MSAYATGTTSASLVRGVGHLDDPLCGWIDVEGAFPPVFEGGVPATSAPGPSHVGAGSAHHTPMVPTPSPVVASSASR